MIMKKINIAILIILVASMTACGTFKKANTNQPVITPTGQGQSTQGESHDDPFAAIVSTLGEWQTLQTGGNISLKGGNNFSSSIQVRMIRDKAIFISLRPVLGIEVGRLLITADSLYAVDKVHKRYVAEKVSILTAGIPVTVSDVQDIFLGRPFIIGKGTISEANKSQVTVSREGSNILLTPNEKYKGYGYSFTFDKSNCITSLDIIPSGSTTPAYQVKFSGVKSTPAGNIAHDINVDATVDKKKMAFSLNYKNIEWNKQVNIDRSIPSNYKRMDAASLFSLF